MFIMDTWQYWIHCSMRSHMLHPPTCSAASHLQFVIGMFIMDTWQYWIHRSMHTSRFLYKHCHSTHHQLWNPYAFGALYNHPLEALLLDTLGASVAMFSLNMTCQLAVAFFCLSTAKTVLDHCSYRFPLNPLHDLFPNSAAYHDVHHDFHGLKANYSQPFFVMWDVIMGTYLDPSALQLSPAEAAATAAAAPAAALTQGGSSNSSSSSSSAKGGVEARTITGVAQAQAEQLEANLSHQKQPSTVRSRARRPAA